MTEFEHQIAAALARAPEWLRRDLLSEDRTTRTRAEEALAAQIAAALSVDTDEPTQ